jgi:hypothetical protein
MDDSRNKANAKPRRAVARDDLARSTGGPAISPRSVPMKPRTLRHIYLREATVMLLMAKLAVRFVSSERLFAWTGRPPGRTRRFSGDEVGWVAWSVERVGSKPWMNALSLPLALAAQYMLRRRGIESRLCLGVARDGNALTAHAWVEIGQHIIVGGVAASGFTRVASFGGGLP